MERVAGETGGGGFWFTFFVGFWFVMFLWVYIFLKGLYVFFCVFLIFLGGC